MVASRNIKALEFRANNITESHAKISAYCLLWMTRFPFMHMIKIWCATRIPILVALAMAAALAGARPWMLRQLCRNAITSRATE
jgi:hypothetical protein